MPGFDVGHGIVYLYSFSFYFFKYFHANMLTAWPTGMIHVPVPALFCSIRN